MSPPSRGGSDVPEDTTHAMILGEMRGQLREVVHGLNNLSGKFDGLSREVIGLAGLAKDVIEIKTQLAQETKDLRDEIDKLKSERDQRTGAANLVTWGFKNWPGVVGFIVLLGIILRSNGKL
jgi:hypothetical protein